MAVSAKRKATTSSRKGAYKGVNKDAAEWSKFLKFIDGCTDSKYLFRGVASDKHELIPKAGRVRNYSDKKEKYVFEQFKRQAATLVKDYTVRSDAEWLAIGQHYGLPTRLLDWTSNPLIATYFAVSSTSNIESEYVKISAFRRSAAISQIDDLNIPAYQDPFLITGESIISPPWVITRITAQRGYFTIHPRPNIPWAPAGLKVHLIPKSSCDFFKERLSQLGYDNSSVLPGLEGVCSALSWVYESS